MCNLKLGVLQKEPVLRQTRETTKNRSLDVAKNYVETYSPSNAAAQYFEERVN